MYDYSDIFKPEGVKSVSELAESVRKTGQLANKCLANEDFKEYRAQFIKTQAVMVDAMITYTNEWFADPKGDMGVYGANMARFVTKLNDLRILTGQVETDIKRGERV